MPLSWKQRGARVLGAFSLGFSSGLAVTAPGFTMETLFMDMAKCMIAGMITALPQFKRVLDDYAKVRR